MIGHIDCQFNLSLLRCHVENWVVLWVNWSQVFHWLVLLISTDHLASSLCEVGALTMTFCRFYWRYFTISRARFKPGASTVMKVSDIVFSPWIGVSQFFPSRYSLWLRQSCYLQFLRKAGDFKHCLLSLLKYFKGVLMGVAHDFYFHLMEIIGIVRISKEGQKH